MAAGNTDSHLASFSKLFKRDFEDFGIKEKRQLLFHEEDTLLPVRSLCIAVSPRLGHQNRCPLCLSVVGGLRGPNETIPSSNPYGIH